MKIASSTCIFGSIQTAIEELTPLGVNALEAYELCVPSRKELYHLNLASKTDAQIAELKSSFDEQDVSICAISGHASLLEKDEEVFSANLAHLHRCIEGAELLGCPIVVTASGHATGDPERDWDRLNTCLGELGEKARGYNVKIALECHAGEFIQSTSDVKRLIESIGSEDVGINYDPWHFEILGEDISDSAKSVAKYVIHTHIHDVPKAEGERKIGEDIPGNGTIDWPSIVRELASVGYNGALSIELHRVFSDRVSDHRSSRTYLESLLP